MKKFLAHSFTTILNRAMLGLYIHFPFCRSKCNYCSFLSAPPQDESQIDDYIEALCIHLRFYQKQVGKRRLSTVYIGGGTPSLAGYPRLARLLDTIGQTFELEADVEITVEVNPESASSELFQGLKSWGCNRISMGAQSFRNRELARLGRVHQAEEIQTALEQARRAGFNHLSLDLIFALPGQTLQQWQYSLHRALDCAPDHLSLYGLSYEEGTLMNRLRHQGKVTPVLDETYRKMYDWTRDFLRDQGWRHYEISNWCQPGKVCRHNLIYWNRDEYLAAGVSAHGMIENRHYALIDDIQRYCRVLHEHEGSSIDFEMSELLKENRIVSQDEMASDVMIFGLRKTEGIAMQEFVQRFHYHPCERWSTIIENLVERDLLEQRNGSLRLTEQAIPISNEVFVHFLD